jgi:peptide/nickel transport system substrate-binding protein
MSGFTGGFSKASAEAQVPSGGVRGGTVYITGGGWGPFTNNFNPFSAAGGTETPVGMIYQTLAIENQVNDTTDPLLATSWSLNSNNSLLTVNLRTGVSWSDGVAFTANDVVFTFNLLKQYPALDTDGLWTVLSNVSSPTANVVTFKFATPAPQDVFYILTTPIVSQHEYSAVSNPVTFADTSPIGTGPFTLVSENAQQIVWAANPNYWVVGEPYVNYVVLVASTTNQQSLLNLLSGTYSYAPMYAPGIVSSFVTPDPSNHEYWIPPVAGFQAIGLNDQEYPLNISSVRQALAYAINQTDISAVAESGYLPPQAQIGLNQYEFPSYVNSTVAQQYAYAYNPSKAMQIFQSLGYKEVNGVMTTPNGTALSFNFPVAAAYTDIVALAQIVKTNLAQVGVQVNIQTVSVNTWVSDLLTGDFDMTQYVSLQGPTPYYAYNDLLNSNFSQPIGQSAGGDFGRYVNSTVDQLLAEWASASNTTQQIQIASKMEVAFGQQMPFIPSGDRVPWGVINSTVFAGWPTPQNPYISPEQINAAGIGYMFQNIYLTSSHASLADVTPGVVTSTASSSSSISSTSSSISSSSAGTSIISTTSATTSSSTTSSSTALGLNYLFLVASIVAVSLLVGLGRRVSIRLRRPPDW